MNSRATAITILISLLFNAHGFTPPSPVQSLSSAATSSDLHYASDSAGATLPLPDQSMVTPPRAARRPATIVKSRKTKEVLSMKDFKSVVIDEPKKIVVCKFYSTWCRVSFLLGWITNNSYYMRYTTDLTLLPYLRRSFNSTGMQKHGTLIFSTDTTIRRVKHQIC